MSGRGNRMRIILDLARYDGGKNGEQIRHLHGNLYKFNADEQQNFRDEQI